MGLNEIYSNQAKGQSNDSEGSAKMTFKEWYAFNKQIRAFNLGNTYVKIM